MAYSKCSRIAWFLFLDSMELYLVFNFYGDVWDGAVHSAGLLRHAPARKEVPKLAPVMAHRVHAEPLSGILFTKEAIVTACHEGHLKVWD